MKDEERRGMLGARGERLDQDTNEGNTQIRGVGMNMKRVIG